MIQIRIHGRGGQGAVTSAELIAIAAFKAGKEAQAFPFFGVERTGAPVEAYARIDEKPIRLREQIYVPDYIIVQDDTLVGTIDVLKGARKDTVVIINTKKSTKDLAKALKPSGKKIITFDASKIAMEIFNKNLMNTVILGAFAKASGLIHIDDLELAIEEKFEEKGRDIIEKNINAARTAYNSISI